ncbi:MAG: histone deacetylase [Spirochaetia bacterium]|nr:histone deacetylase [Spirochaetia bacterium]
MVYSHKYNLELGGHVFPAIKYEQLFNLINMDEEMINLEFLHPEPVEKSDLELVHTKEYLDDLFSLRISKSTKNSELPLNNSILETFLYGVGGTILATELTEKHDFVYNIGGGYHHSYADHAEGFCYLNDVAVAIRKFQKIHPNKKILIIDLDVHQGNGNSKIFEKDENVFTFSMHQESIYPKKELSKLDIGLKDFCTDSEYLRILSDSLKQIELQFKPDLMYYLAGADPYEDDRLGSLKITKNGLIERDKKVKEFAIKNNSKVVVLTAGGYARNTVDTVLIHFNTARVFHRK